MNHRTLPRFWEDYKRLPKDIQALADKNFVLLKSDAHHPSLHFKKVNIRKQLWSVRIGAHNTVPSVWKSPMVSSGFGSVLMPITINR